MTLSEETRLLIAKVEEPAIQKWAGMPIEQLLDYSSDPFWVRLRYFCFGFFWFAFVMLAVSVVFLVVTAPRCRNVEWWQEGPMYGVIARDLRKGNTSGADGLSGIESKLDYIVELGAKTIWLSPIYKSPMKDFGYDIEDFKDVDESFGTLQDFKDLVQAMKNRGLKVVMDLIPNHSSDRHVWFQKSVYKEDPYTHYYVWAPAKGYEDGKPTPPNNWLSVLGGSAWEWNEDRKEFYLHQFAKEQPDLNFRNPEVKEEMLDVMRFWLELGLDGFRVDAMPHLFEDEALRDEPPVNLTAVRQGDYRGLEHVHTHNLPEVFSVMAEFRSTLDAYSERTDKVRRLMMAEIYDSVEKTVEYYGDQQRPQADFPFNFYLMTNIQRDSSAHDIKNTIELWMSNLPETKWTNWVLGNHDHGQEASGLGGDLVDCLNMILLMLPGTAVTYHGEELGMENTPVPWDASGVSANYKDSLEQNSDETWSPLHADIKTSQKPDHLNIYKALVRARRDLSIMYGDLEMRVLSDSVFAFTRSRAESRSYVVAVNWSNRSLTVDLGEFGEIPEVAEVYVTSVNFRGASSKTIQTNSILLEARAGVVLSYMPEARY